MAEEFVSPVDQMNDHVDWLYDEWRTPRSAEFTGYARCLEIINAGRKERIVELTAFAPL
jgi:hypothetical protein